jgi:hypothetical protein
VVSATSTVNGKAHTFLRLSLLLMRGSGELSALG